MKKLDTRLIRLMRHSKGQFIAISMVIILGLMMYVSFSSAFVNLNTSLNYHYDTHNFSDVFAELIRINPNEVNELNSISGIQYAEGRVVYDVPLNVADENEKVNVRIMTSPYGEDSINALYALEGVSSVQKNGECLVIDKFAEARNIKIGDIITPHIGGRDHYLEVVGIVSSPEFVYLMENEQTLIPAYDKFGIVYTTEEFGQEALGIGESYNQVLLAVEPDINLDEIVKVLEKKLDRYGLRRIYSKDDQLSNRMIGEEMKGLKQMASSVPLIFLGIAAFIMGVMISRLVKGDRIAIGILKSMGYSNNDIVWHYTKLSVAIGFFGGTVGVILGYAVSVYFTDMYNQFFSIPTLKLLFRIDLVFLSGLLVTMFSVASGLFGASKAMKISPSEAMRPEAPRTGKRIWLETTKIWKFIRFSDKMVLRNLLRNKKRIFFISMGIAFTFAVVITPFAMYDAFMDMFDTTFGEFQTMDYNLNFSQGTDDGIIYEMRNELDADHIEGKVEFPFTINNKSKSKVVNLIGIEEGSMFFNFRDLNMDPTELGSGDFFLSEGLAKVLEVNENDYITLETFIPGRDDIDIKVTKIIKQNLGSNAYMLLGDVQHLLLDDAFITGVYIKTDKNIKGDVEDYRIVSSIQSLKDMIDVFDEFLGITIASLSIMIVFGGILGFAIVYNSTVISINERRLEFSSLRVMGFTKNEIFTSLLKENVINSLLGIALGIPIAIIMLANLSDIYSTELYSFDIILTPVHYILAAVTTLIFVVIALLAADKKIHGLNFIEALKNRIT